MIAELVLIAALAVAESVDDFQLPTCAVGEEAVPFEDGYVCGPADPALPEPSPLPTIAPEKLPTFTAKPLPVEMPSPVAPRPAPVDTLAETGPAEDRLLALTYGALALIPLGAGLIIRSAVRRDRSTR